MPIHPITNFIAGIRAASGLTPYKDVAAARIENFDVDDYGRLTKRRGYARMNATALAAVPKAMKRAYYRKASGLSAREHLIVLLTHATGCWYWNGSAFAELKNSSASPATSIDNTGGRDARYGFEVYGGRLFMGTGSANRQFWVDISAATPVAYNHGVDAPDAPTVAAGGAGGTLTAGWYGYVITFYRTGEAIETTPSTRVTVQVTSGQQVTISDIDVCSDLQMEQRKIYRTAVQSSETAAEAAQLYHLHTIEDNTTTTWTDDGSTSLSTTILPSEDWDAPGQWHYILGDGGRLWLCDDDDSNVAFSPFDATGAPVLDAFPSANVVRVNPDDGDIITAITPTPGGINQRIVTKRNATYIFYGDTVGNIQLARSKAVGCVAPWSVAAVSLPAGGDVVFFLGGDRQVWAVSGGAPQLVSKDVNPLLADIPASRFKQVMGCGYAGKYLLAFPEDDNENDAILVYDATKQYWTLYDIPANWLEWWAGDESTDADKNRLVAASSSEAYLYYVFTDADGDDLTADAGTAITASWKSNHFYFPEPSIITAVYIYDVTGSTYTVRVDYTNDSGAHTGTEHTSFTPTANNNYRQGVFERGRTFQVYIATQSTEATIERIEIEWRPV